MGFLSGNATFQRYWITQDPTADLGTDHLNVLEKFKIGKSRADSLDQPNVGFLGGAHLLDTCFDLEKNVILDAMHFAIRIDTNAIPSAIRKAWLQMELAALTADDPGSKPSKKQRQEAREAVDARCADEAATGRFRRMQQIPVLWDARSDVLYIGSTSSTANELCLNLMQRAFELELEPITSGKLANAYATETDQLEQLYKAVPSPFWGERSAGEVTWWNGMAENFDYMGNEFLLWLWWRWETQSDVIALADDSEVSGMFARTLTLDCPQGESGKETISAESPVSLPEAALAIRSGKLPRKAGLTLACDEHQYDLTLQAESFNVGSAKIKRTDDGDDDLEQRLDGLRALADTLDLLFENFCERRIGKGWNSQLKQVQNWLLDGKLAAVRNSAA